MRHVKRIVAGVDGSDAALSAARWALHEAHRCGATLTVVHAWQIHAPVAGSGALPDAHVAAFLDAAQQVLDAVMKRLRAEPEAAEVDLDPVLIPGPAGAVLVDESTDADMLVVGSHGQADAGPALLGSVAAYCIFHATCSTLIVPPRPLAEHRREWLSLVSAGPEPAGPPVTALRRAGTYQAQAGWH